MLKTVVLLNISFFVETNIFIYGFFVTGIIRN